MDSISSVDHLVLLLRQRLMERSKLTAGRSAPKSVTGDPRAGSLSSVQALAGLEQVDDRQLSRALVQNILAEHFGAALVNDAQFQQIVDRVAETMDMEPGAAKLLASMVREFRNAAK